jgi:3-methyladenine DNA glycosylase AlkC
MAKKLKEFFDKEMLIFLADKLSEKINDFDKKTFVRNTNKLILPLELKDRVKVVGQKLYECIPGEYTNKTKILTSILGPENDGDFGTFNDFFWTWPISSVVEQFGQEQKKESLELIYNITKRGTGEFAIRQFIKEDPKAMLKVMKRWSKDKNFHVRRLSSEGWRPRLPWAKKLDVYLDNPDQVLGVLKSLNNDSSRYVQNSVANHMGDMLKLNREYTMSVLNDWSENSKDNTKWIIRHAVRNLRKKEDKEAIDLTERMKL